jgi:hypothetical protein
MRGTAIVGSIGVLALVLAACGDESESKSGLPECTEANSLCTLIRLPADFNETPDHLAAAFIEKVPPTGVPAAMAALIEDPAIGVDKPFTLTVDKCLEKPEEYYLYVILYVKGGGMWEPTPGKDYVGHSEKKKFGADPVNLPEITLTVAQ